MAPVLMPRGDSILFIASMVVIDNRREKQEGVNETKGRTPYMILIFASCQCKIHPG